MEAQLGGIGLISTIKNDRKRVRSKKRRRTISIKRKEKLSLVYTISKELNEKNHELSLTNYSYNYNNITSYIAIASNIIMFVCPLRSKTFL